MQVQPRETIPLVYLISDPSDVNTYYVRAVMRNSSTGSTLKTTNLTGSGRRFTGNIQAPQDASGRGTWIDITVSVYTDAGYTTPSDSYQEQVFQYVVQERISSALLAAGATARETTSHTAEDVDYKKIRAILEDVFSDGIGVLRKAILEAERGDGVDYARLEAAMAAAKPDMGAVELTVDRLRDAVADLVRRMPAGLDDANATLDELATVLDRIERTLPDMKTEQVDIAPIMEELQRVNKEKITPGIMLSAFKDIARDAFLSLGLGAAMLGRSPEVKQKRDYQAEARALLGGNKS